MIAAPLPVPAHFLNPREEGSSRSTRSALTESIFTDFGASTKRPLADRIVFDAAGISLTNSIRSADTSARIFKTAFASV
jgi:hypothetical protein